MATKRKPSKKTAAEKKPQRLRIVWKFEDGGESIDLQDAIHMLARQYRRSWKAAALWRTFFAIHHAIISRPSKLPGRHSRKPPEADMLTLWAQCLNDHDFESEARESLVKQLAQAHNVTDRAARNWVRDIGI